MPKRRAAERSVDDEQTQGVKLATDSQVPGSGMAALAAVDTAVPDEDSAFMDMRDPMVSADGHRPTKTEIVRLGVGFTVSAIACAIPWVALSTVILPRVFEQIDAGSKVFMLGLVNSIGAFVALIANIVFGTLSDQTRSRFGKRTPWIVLGGLITGLSIGVIAFTRSEALIVTLWCLAQMGYNMMLAPYVAVMSDRVPDKVRGTISGFYGAGIAVGQTLGSVVGAAFLTHGASGIFQAWMMGLAIFSLVGIFVVVWPREKSSKFEADGETMSTKAILRNFRPPRHAPDFYYALVGRTLMMRGYWMITTYQLYIAQDYIYAGDPHAIDKASAIIATMGVITLVVSLIVAVTAGPNTDRIGRRELPVRRRRRDAAAVPLSDGHVSVRRDRRSRLRRLQRDRPGAQRGRAAESEGGGQGSGHPQPREHAFDGHRHDDDVDRRFDREIGDACVGRAGGRLCVGVRRRDRHRAHRGRAHHAHPQRQVTRSFHHHIAKAGDVHVAGLFFVYRHEMLLPSLHGCGGAYAWRRL